MTGQALVKNDLRELLRRAEPEMARVLPRHLTPERMASLALLACTVNPDLLACDPRSVVRAVMSAAALGLEINGPLGHAYLVKYGTLCNLIPGYRGLVYLAKAGGAIKAGEARLVYQDELFDVEYGTEPRIVHKPDFKGDRSDEAIVAAYFVATLPDGSKQFEVMSLEEINAIRRRSKASSSGPWKSDFGEMARKTVTKRALKYLPMSNPEAQSKLGTALELDNRFESGKVSSLVETDTPEVLSALARESTQAKMSDLRERIGAGRDVTPEEPEPEPTTWGEDAEPDTPTFSHLEEEEVAGQEALFGAQQDAPRARRHRG